ncbi:putative non-reducing end alpha-L-arabinofuranosidase [Medicago truncatula]|uniref:non-reducing end alpha-L-arabinofuranosidase n=1 Tax=Medicago truncatula TaxID=3880 RepID=A0A396H2Q9_MEDTR|nr:putative non-reducing end alpha-L-arabinofuranosidase [Medicago truncatula]
MVISDEILFQNIVKGKKYKVVFYYSSTGPLDLTVSFRDGQGGGAILGSSHIIKPNKKGAKWKKIESIITASASSPNAGITLRTTKKGTIWLDQVSAMPQDTYKGHGFRTDLVEMVQKLKPAFLRFPGGCFVEGVTLRNAFRWKESVGPWEERAGHFNDIWKYWTDDGLGFYEGLLLAEDVNATPIWVFNNGISHTDEIDTKDIQPFVQEALDGIEFARGPSSSKWGSLRASMGHPEPFVLKYVAIGNEDCGLKNYLGNYLVFHKEIRKYYPDILMISNCDASRKPLDHPADLYDYHIYPVDDVHMMFTNAEVFDHTPRNGPKAFVSEYALIGANIARHGTLIGGLSEAGFLIGLERNSDHVAMAAYAPLFVNANDRVWNPDAIVFSSNQVYGTPSYWVTYLFKESNGATFLNSTLQTTDPGTLAASAILVKDPQNKNTYLKIKIANMRKTQVDFKISIQGFASKNLKGSTKTVLTGNELDENSFAEPKKIAPQTSPLQNPGNEMNVIVQPTSLTILDMF